MGIYSRKFQSQKVYLKATLKKKKFWNNEFVILPPLKIQKKEKEERELFLQQCK